MKKNDFLFLVDTIPEYEANDKQTPTKCLL